MSAKKCNSMRQVCKEAEIEVVSRDSVEQVPTQYLTKGRPQV